MLEPKVGDRVRTLEGVTGTVMRREHDFEHPRYVIAWDDGEQSEIWPNQDPDLEEHLQRELEEDIGAD
jgi:hypothetical protein